MSYCRITGRVRGLPKDTHFQLLPAISKDDAKRFCRITSKSFGLSTHHFIPVKLTSQFSNIAKCKVTSIAKELIPHHYLLSDYEHGQRKHEILSDFRYIYPALDEANDAHKDLIKILQRKNIDDGNFVYAVEENQCNLVFSAHLEAAVRDGDIKEVLLTKDSDQILFKMKRGPNISADLKTFNENSHGELFDGEGPNEKVLRQRHREEVIANKLKQKRQQNLSQMKKMYEEKLETHQNGDTQMNSIKKSNHKKLIKKSEDKSEKNKKNVLNFDLKDSKLKSLSIMMNPECASDLMKPLIESWDWDTYEKEAAKTTITNSTSAVVLPPPIRIKPINLKTKIHSHPETSILENTTGFENVVSISTLFPFTKKPDKQLLVAIKKINRNKLEKTASVADKLESFENGLDLLPTEAELPLIIKNIASGTKCEVANVSGLKLEHKEVKREIFVTGQMIKTHNREVFVPGQTFSTEQGLVYVPGITMNTPHGISFIPGHVIDDNVNEPIFMAGQIIDDEFIPGQTLHNGIGSRFVDGQTVLTHEGFKFVAGVIDEANNQFVCGQNLQTPTGVKFIPGQTVTVEDGEKFVAGQSVFDDEQGWKFIHGQSMTNESGIDEFIPGRTVSTEEGSKFIPGQTVEETFVPGITKAEGNELKFIPGMNVETKQGPKFIEGQIVSSDCGQIFMPGKTLVNKKSGEIEFAIAKNINDVVFNDPTNYGFVIDPINMEVTTPNLSVFGHMIQTANGIEFYPEKIKKEHLPEGKVIPGRLIKQDANTKFIPGIMGDNGFIPGQVVWTENGEQFVPGQVIETSEGLKFVPGQVIETKSGSKFVPGQTTETANGPRFVPGQIVLTKAGPTFIPGQVIYTEEEGERFVPGQVVDTEDGPRFVPGRVIETDDKVTFIPGQIVQTAEGPKFIAPDLMDNEEGEQEFSVQSFQITPEELQLLKPSNSWTTTASTRGELSIDTKMMRKLSEAGMRIGRQTEASVVDIVLQCTKDRHVVEKFMEKFGSGRISEDDDYCMFSLFEDLKSIVNHVMGKKQIEQIEVISHGRLRDREISNITNSLAEIIAEIATAVEGNESSLYEHISRVLALNWNKLDFSKVQDLMKQPNFQHNLIMSVSKVIERGLSELDILQTFLSPTGTRNEFDIIRRLSTILKDDDMTNAVRAMTDTNPKILYKIINHLKENTAVNFIGSNAEALATVQKAINWAVKEITDNDIRQLFLSENKEKINELVLDVIGLAKILDMPLALEKISNAIKEGRRMSILFDDESIAELFRRVIIMQKLAVKDDVIRESLGKLRTDPSAIRNDVTLRDIIQKSGILTIPTNERSMPPEHSKQVPNILIVDEDKVPIADYFVRRRHKNKGGFLLMKNNIQGIVQRGSCRNILSDKCSYTLLDEDGISNFEPLHVVPSFNLTVTPPTLAVERRFSMFNCDMGTARNERRFSMFTCDIAPVGAENDGNDLMAVDSSTNSLLAVAAKMKINQNLLCV